jgi:hypothetical protein
LSRDTSELDPDYWGVVGYLSAEVLRVRSGRCLFITCHLKKRAKHINCHNCLIISLHRPCLNGARFGLFSDSVSTKVFGRGSTVQFSVASLIDATFQSNNPIQTRLKDNGNKVCVISWFLVPMRLSGLHLPLSGSVSPKE